MRRYVVKIYRMPLYAEVNRRKFGGKEYLTEFGLDEYDFGARRLDPRLGHFTTPDPLAGQNPSISPWAYCNGDPINFIDPTGEYTEVVHRGNGIYEIVGGSIDGKDKDDYNIYVVDADNVRTGEILGITATPYSFYNFDPSSEESGQGWQKGQVIDLNDLSGICFLNNIISDKPSLIRDYIPNARNNHKYDFKATNGNGNERDNSLRHYRGMPIGKTANNMTIIASARDIGNMVAGYMSASNCIPWFLSRFAYDTYQWIESGTYGELQSTQSAERYGWDKGNKEFLLRLSNYIDRLGSFYVRYPFEYP